MSIYQMFCLAMAVAFAIVAWLPAQDSKGVRIANALNLLGAVVFAYVAGLPVA